MFPTTAILNLLRKYWMEGGARDAHPPLDLNSFILMQFSANIAQQNNKKA